ncbi:Ubiquitin carboxyl-terminal hydrolase 23 [Tetrabaena socialis]|uniref:Ubiquitin carboxyl-terminal hydrolase 23 n=1 Tax=Tetrabaena socialis TaxID=47790 RepID=A0A2J7ZIX3_9CHLO|nr:Ubiquitin carboxyl-terminal hydrolase 23 [Tetrabaena socialis]|eukprot:PNH00213.1 Ubiquitin carboxyl-terminal hydrolase 23 [Tetrabaena socialis]
MASHWDATVTANQCPLTQAMYGQFVFLTQCQECKHVTQSFDVFSSLPVLFDETETTASVQQHADQVWASSESIEGYQCDHCNNKSMARRECKISRMPDVLVVHAMRFADGDRKMTKDLHAEHEIDVSAAQLQVGPRRDRELYRLRGMVCHRGMSRHGGHYYAVCKCTSMKTSMKNWVGFDDDAVTMMEDRSCVRKGDPYLLIYERSS